MAETQLGNSHFHDEEDAHHNHHVHFSEDVTPNTDIQVKMKGKSEADVHVGFLQLKHKYEIEFNIPKAPEAKLSPPSEAAPTLRIVEVTPSGDGKGQKILLELDAHKEGLLHHKFVLENHENKEKFKVVLHARVLGSKKGRPMLRDGIKCIHVDKDDEDDGEHSDWKGFE
ncbi:UPF0687 protein C20orf27 homolog [Nematostella vectensis]|uniref:UPF0687 protein C20orf27 homolog n=1 Tax=Nematostella vectensis TaxID=45351 RepID=UPI002076FE1D|nr:UPF0687 protein C20orf27 homolog [Nematostella vectensis]